MGTQTSLAEIPAAVYAILAPAGVLDSTLAGLGITGLFDFRAVPEDQPFDYITLGDAAETPENTFGRRGYSSTLLLHIWSRASGSKTANSILARLNALLDQRPLALASQAHIFTLYDWSTRIADTDGLTLHVPVRYKIFTQE